MPAAWHAAMSSGKAPAVTASTGTRPAAPGRARMRLVASRPSSPGIITSISTASKGGSGEAASAATASSPPLTQLTLCPADSSSARSTARLAGTSSATSTRSPRLRAAPPAPGSPAARFAATSDGAAAGAAGAAPAAGSSGSSVQNSAPRPPGAAVFASQPMRPSMRAAMCAAMARPSPVPSGRSPSWTKSPKTSVAQRFRHAGAVVAHLDPDRHALPGRGSRRWRASPPGRRAG